MIDKKNVLITAVLAAVTAVVVSTINDSDIDQRQIIGVSVEDFGAVPDDNEPDDIAFSEALSAATAKGVPLIVPPGVWDLSETLRLGCADCEDTTRGVAIHGSGDSARIKSLANPAIGFVDGSTPKYTRISSLWLSGVGDFNAGSQDGIGFCGEFSPGLYLSKLYLTSFSGRAICASSAYNARIVSNKMTAVGTGIRCESCRISLIESNRVSTYFETGIFVGSDPGNPTDAGSINVRISLNEVMNKVGDDCTKSAIEVGTGSFVEVSNNYLEGVGGDCTGLPGIAIGEVRTTRNASVRGNYSSGNNTGPAILVKTNAFYTIVENNNGTTTDDGLMTSFIFTQSATGSDIKGASTSRRGFVSRPGWFEGVPNRVYDLSAK